MKNNLVCKNCKAENPFYGLICRTCKSNLRERIYNIDFWKVLSLLTDSPGKAFSLIIRSEHKNYILLILIFVSGKFLVDTKFISTALNHQQNLAGNIIINYLIIFLLSLLIIGFLAFLLTWINKNSGLDNRFFDNFSILIYSQIPHAYGLLILFPIELILFGRFLFSNNPSPFVVKETIAYIMLSFEILLILWAIFLTISGVYTQSRNLKYSIAAGLLINTIIIFIFYAFSYYF